MHNVSGSAQSLCELDVLGALGAGGRPVRLGIMGGTFDPIHVGHLACAEWARDRLKLDRVLFVPAGQPVFKKDRAVTPSAHRLAMCRLAVASNPAFGVSAIELERGGDTYTVDTLRELRAACSDDVELVFITGADAAATLPSWRESAELARLARFAAVTRPGFELDAAQRELLAQAGFRMSYVDAAPLDISSSDLRRRLAAGESARYLVPDEVLNYIEANGLYRAIR